MAPPDPTGSVIELSLSGLVYNCNFDILDDQSYQVAWYVDGAEILVVDVEDTVATASWALDDIGVDYYTKPVRYQDI